MKEITIGQQLQQTVIVTDSLLACHVGSGTVSVYATPMMIALMEGAAAACLQQFLAAEQTSVGTAISTTHEAATPIGMEVRATATITAVDGKKVSFSIVAEDEVGVIGKATHDRFVVDKARFEARAQQKLNGNS